jgi:hypothetical protein
LQKYTSPSSAHVKRNQRREIKEKCSEKITSSRRLDEPKQKALKPNRKRRLFTSTKQTFTSFAIDSDDDDCGITTTATKRHKLPKQTNEIITSSYTTHAISIVPTSPCIYIISDEDTN